MSKKVLRRALKRVLVVHKHSTFQQEAVVRKDAHFLRLIEQGSRAVSNMPRSHEQHYQCIEAVRAELARRGVEARFITRDDPFVVEPDTDLVISIGGDGTFLHCARKVNGVPLLGINSAKPSSLGHYCIADIDSFTRILDEIESGKRRVYRIARLELTLDGEVLPVPVLNEVLVHDSCPGGTTRYILTVRGREEVQRSSGLYIGPAAGTTAVMRSARGRILPITQRKFQYIVREPGMRPTENWKLLGGILNSREEIRILSQTPDGMLYIDGKYGSTFAFPRGSELVVRLSHVDVLAYIDANVNRRYRKID